MGEQNNETEDRHASREQEREFALRVAEQAENLRGPMLLSGASAQEAVTAMASALASKKRTDRIIDFYSMDDAIEIANTIRDQNVREIDVIAGLVLRNARNEREIAVLRCELADLRGAQSVDRTGAHPYRSAPQAATAAPSSPVVTSGAFGRGEGRPGALRRVYGALRACAAPLAGLGLFWFISSPHAPTWVLVVGCATTVTLTLAFRAIVFRAIGWLS